MELPEDHIFNVIITTTIIFAILSLILGFKKGLEKSIQTNTIIGFGLILLGFIYYVIKYGIFFIVMWPIFIFGPTLAFASIFIGAYIGTYLKSLSNRAN